MHYCPCSIYRKLTTVHYRFVLDLTVITNLWSLTVSKLTADDMDQESKELGKKKKYKLSLILALPGIYGPSYAQENTWPAYTHLKI